MRAFCYFYLVNLYGDVPLITEIDYRVTSLKGKTQVSQVFEQIKTDLFKAQDLLSSNYLDGKLLNVTSERVRPTKGAATALLARIYLYMQDFANAEVQANSVIGTQVTYSIVPLKAVFQKNSLETIWALQNVGSTTSSNTGEAKLFVITTAGPSFKYQVYVSDWLKNSFEPGDRRFSNWMGKVTDGSKDYYFPFKYKIGEVNTPAAEYPIVLRLAEQYLIRAEARIQQGKIADGIGDLNVLRTRATDLNASANLQLKQLESNLSKADALAAVLHERQVELFTEWGHRWFDLKRTGTINTVMPSVTAIKGGTWNANAALYPIPAADVLTNPNLAQNPGYQ